MMREIKKKPNVNHIDNSSEKNNVKFDLHLSISDKKVL